MCVCVGCLTTPGSFISAMRYSGSPAGGSTSKVNSGLGTVRKWKRLKTDTEKDKAEMERQRKTTVVKAINLSHKLL